MARFHLFAFQRVGLVVLPIVLVLGGSARAESGSTDIAQRVLRSQTLLAEGLMRSLAQAHPGENIVVSPASLAGMLTAADLGAGPATHEAIRKTLQIAPGAPGTQEMEALRAATIHAADEGDLTLATRLMFDRSEPLTAEGRKRLDQAGVETAVEDLHGSGAVADIDAWAARATAGKITHVLDSIDPLDEMIALNALLFKARWAVEFRASGTPADFHLASGQRVRVPFMHMHGPGRLRVQEDHDFIGVQLPFSGNQYVMTLVTSKNKPMAIGSFGDHLGWLSGDGFNDQDMVFVDMPPFRVLSRADLMTSLAALGFNSNEPFLAFTRDKLVLSQIMQITDIKLDENGAEVAAVTVGGFETRGRMMFQATDVVIDKPFAYAINDTRTGVTVAAGFMASIDGPILAADVSPVSAKSPDVMTPDRIEAINRAIQQGKARAAAEAAKQPKDAPTREERLRLERDF